MLLPYISSPKIKVPVCGLYINRRFVIRRISMISRSTWTTIRDFSTCLCVRAAILRFFLSIVFYHVVKHLVFPFYRFLICRNRSGFTDAAPGCRKSRRRRFFRSITLSAKGRICRKCTSNHRIERGSRPLHPGKPERRREMERGKRKRKG